ncbi:MULTISPECIES: STAS domain-containing protein [unclassified Streptomyces]|uniref:STAS domain-containing protein n=1 Tax=unclassified Streptomyces TaxID=2593676 RepID=UPI0037128688
MTTPLSLTSRQRPDATAVLKAVGEIDMSNSDALASALDALPDRVVVDLTEVAYLDSAALSVFFAHAGRVELLATDLLLPVLEISGLTGLVTVREVPSPTGPDDRHGAPEA